MSRTNDNATTVAKSFETANVTSTNATVSVGEFLNGLSAFYDGRTFRLTGVALRIVLTEDEIAERDELITKAQAEGKSDEQISTIVQQFINELVEKNGKKLLPVFETDIPDSSAVIWLSSYRTANTKLDSRNQPVLRDGDFDTRVYDALANASADSDALELCKKVLSEFKDKTITVRRKFYQSGQFNKTASIPCFDTSKQ